MFEPEECPADCRYLMQVHSGLKEKVVHCGYILLTERMRGCDPGPGCRAYEPGKRLSKSVGRTVKTNRGPKFTWDERTGFRMWLEGATDREIADELGVSRDLVGDTRRRKWMKEAKRNA